MILPAMPSTSWSVWALARQEAWEVTPLHVTLLCTAASQGHCWSQGLARPWAQLGQSCSCCFQATLVQMPSTSTSKSLQLQPIEVYIFLN